ncbi:MAG TPA: hypothetical protein VLH56_16870 [Dissulfurispiraceae bacterium]|nr:hypothetical protein [Dissulfurispiraceae bacterium]
MKTFNTLTCPITKGGEPRIHFSGAGLRFNEKARETLKLTVDDRVAFEQDESGFYIKRDPLGFSLKPGKDSTLKIFSARLVYELRLAAGGGRMHFRVGEHQGDRWLLHAYKPGNKNQGL